MPLTRLLMVTPSLHIGGAERHVVDLSRILQSKGLLVEVVSSGGILEKELAKSKIRHVTLDVNKKNPLHFKTILLLRKLLKLGNYDIIHIHAVMPTILCWLASFGLRCRIVVTVHGLEASNYSFAGRILSRLSNRVIAVSRGIYHDLLKGGMDKNKLAIVHNGIDTNKFAPCSIKTEYQTVFIGAVGRLSPEKGHQYLFRAISHLKSRDIKCFIIGGGALEKELKELAESLQVADKIVITGFVSDVQSAIEQMDIMVMPSLREGLPIALLEAMSMGKAVIASEVGGIPDVITHNKTGLLVRAANVKELAAAIEYMLDKPARRRALGKEAHQYIVDQFQIEKMVEGIIGIYDQTLNRKTMNDDGSSSIN
ncbi:glycosyltransferase family 4 protein [Bacillus sp. ISL-39]|uniref:glycosyltransferase family 4 protein n=1 Tax=Bacillus sp. ISL-39 TaxID=2819124 RepID=UPI001BE55421|nr:glycosyltransferase family 4 protein [Bacillus sp. ISL-39]MBT2639687.1 glycosyltransferase family 4 protein [Bacillus sp. ISL-39]